MLWKHHAVLSTFGAGGSIPMSVVTVGPVLEGAAFTTTVGRAQFVNLLLNPRCTILISGDAWSPYVVLHGPAKLCEKSTTESEALRLILREVFRKASGKEHPDWSDYYRAVERDGRVAVVIIPDKIYGTG